MSSSDTRPPDAARRTAPRSARLGEPVAPTAELPRPVKPSSSRIAEELVIRWRLNPLLFVLEALLPNREKQVQPTAQQAQALDAVGQITRAKIKKYEIDEALRILSSPTLRHTATPEHRLLANVKLTPREVKLAALSGVSIRSGRSCGKDTLAAWLICWFNMTMPNNMKSLVTAPTFSQLIDVLWGEVSKWFNGTDAKGNFVVPGHDDYTLASDKFFLKALNGKEHFIAARTARQGTSSQAGSLRGYHEDYMILIFDEASDIPDPTAESLLNTLTGPVNLAIVIFNPVYSHGWAWRTHCDDKEKRNWWRFRFNSEESPLVSKAYLDRLRARGGPDTNLYRINVLGEFPLSESDVLIPYEFVRAAALRSTHPEEASTTAPGAKPLIVLGIDVAGEGADSTVVAVRHDNTLLRFHETSRIDPNALHEWLLNIISEEDPDEIAIDATGLGWAVAGRLRPFFPKLVSVLFQSAAADSNRFVNRRTEIYWRMRTAFVDEQCIVIPNEEFLVQELSTGKYKLAGTKIALRPKLDIKRELGFSPDHADAFALTFHFTSAYLELRRSSEEDDDYSEFAATRASRRPHWSRR
jgi:phage terminase large subunit